MIVSFRLLNDSSYWPNYAHLRRSNELIAIDLQTYIQVKKESLRDSNFLACINQHETSIVVLLAISMALT